MPNPLTLSARDFESIYTDLVTAIPSLAPVWTNAGAGDSGSAILAMLAGVGDMLAFYNDRTAEECFLPTARTRDALVRLCALIDYRLARPVAAATKLRFTLTAPAGSNVTIPKYTVAQTAGGVAFATAQDAIIFTGQTQVTVDAFQGRLVTDVFTATGADPQTYNLTANAVAQNFLNVVVSGSAWSEDSVDAAFAALGIYDVSADQNSNSAIRFSSYLGNVPALNSVITATYLQTLGAAGNLGAGLVTTMISTIAGQPGITVTNTVPAAAGADRETLDHARASAPRKLRTLNRAVTLQDYVDLTELFAGYAKAQSLNHSGYVELYAAPATGGALFVKRPTFTLAAAATGSLSATTYYVRITAVDAYGETSSWEYTPATRASVDNITSQAVSAGQKIVATITRVAGAVSYNLYIGTGAGTQYYVSTVADPGSGSTFTANILTAPGSGVTVPATNTTGARAADGTSCLRTQLETYLEQRRTLCTSFAVFNPTYVPITVTATINIYSNYLQSDVQSRVQAALSTMLAFANQSFGVDVPIAAFYQTIMGVLGVQSVAWTAPTGDTTINDGEIATLGTVTLTMAGGVVG